VEVVSVEVCKPVLMLEVELTCIGSKPRTPNRGESWFWLRLPVSRCSRG
jgi:hypothetical protein